MIYLKGEQWDAVLEYKTWQVGDGENKLWLWKRACVRIKIREDKVINIQNASVFFIKMTGLKLPDVIIE